MCVYFQTQSSSSYLKAHICFYCVHSVSQRCRNTMQLYLNSIICSWHRFSIHSAAISATFTQNKTINPTLHVLKIKHIWAWKSSERHGKYYISIQCRQCYLHNLFLMILDYLHYIVRRRSWLFYFLWRYFHENEISKFLL